jgi:hypothetical protein
MEESLASTVNRCDPILTGEVSRLAALRRAIEVPPLGDPFHHDSLPLWFWHKFEKKGVPYDYRHVEPPGMLYASCRAQNKEHALRALNADLCVSFGGTVSPTASGARLTQLLAKIVAELKGTVISGGVVGVDTYAHMGALDGQGKTIAVLANPVDAGLHWHEPLSNYPVRSFLQSCIIDAGALISEYGDVDSTETSLERLLQRDRIITGCSDLFVAIECSEESATVDTAKRAFIQGQMLGRDYPRVIAIKWSNVKEKWRDHVPKQSGNEELLRERRLDGSLAKPIPSQPNASYEAIEREFREYLLGILEISAMRPLEQLVEDPLRPFGAAHRLQ